MKKSYYHLSKFITPSPRITILLAFLLLLVILAIPVVIFFPDPLPNTREDIQAEAFEAASEEAYWRTRLKEEKGVTVYKELKNQYSSADFGTQHLAAHLFGEVLYQQVGHKGIAVCDSEFSFGCYHGFFSSAISKEGVSVAAKLNQACIDQFKSPDACQHGLGHGLLEYFGTDDLVDALYVCESLTPDKPLHGCRSGVFMQYNLPIAIESGNSQLRMRPLEASEPYQPCPNLPEQFRQACYYELPQLWDKFYEYGKIGLLCQGISGENEQIACYRGVGNVAAPSTYYDVEQTIALCEKMPEYDGQVRCLFQASWSFEANTEAKVRAHLVCKNLSEKEKAICVKEADTI